MSSIVNTEHPDYSRMAGQWKRCRDTVAGREAILAAGVEYLPSLKDMTVEDYKSYALRASYVNYVWKTVSSLCGMLFRKPPEIEVAASVEPLIEDITMDGRSLFIFAQQVAIEVLTSGRLGVLVDYPQQDTTGMTAADAAKLNLRPTMAMYKAETIINWKTQRTGNENKLVLIVLTEDFALDENEFEHEAETHYRVLDLTVKPANPGDNTPGWPVYRQRVFRINDKSEDEQVGGDIFPMMNGKPMNEIPFIFIGIDDTTPEMDEPPLIDLVDVNLDHYRLSADLKHGLHFGGLPTAVISGYTPENAGDKLYIGSASAWVFPDPSAKASYLEFTGQGLKPIAEEMVADESRMAILGARLLSSEKRTTETAQTAQIHRAGESSILSSIAQTISIGLTEALEIFSEWAGVPDSDAMIELNRDFLPLEMDAQTLTALVSSWQSGAISHESLFDQLKQGEIIRDNVTFEDEQNRIASAPIPKPEVYPIAGE